MTDQLVAELLSYSLFETEFCPDEAITADVLEELKQQGVIVLLYYRLKEFRMEEELRQNWSMVCLNQIARNARLSMYEQQLLAALDEAEIPVVVLKGSSAAENYPHPELRSSGDIDLLVKPKDFERACTVLKEFGCAGSHANAAARHAGFRFYETEIELHRRFADMDDPVSAELLDSLLFAAMDRAEKHRLPSSENGLVILQHLNHHLMTGLGLRQVIDWMMFADKQLDVEFLTLADSVGLKELALSVTQMCQQYLGLRQIVPQRDQSALWEYLLESGNFGRKTPLSLKKTERAFAQLKRKNVWLKRPYKIGLRKLKLRPGQGFPPFIWLYGAYSYFRTILHGGSFFRTLVRGKQRTKARREMFKKMGVTRYIDRK